MHTLWASLHLTVEQHRWVYQGLQRLPSFCGTTYTYVHIYTSHELNEPSTSRKFKDPGIEFTRRRWLIEFVRCTCHLSFGATTIRAYIHIFIYSYIYTYKYIHVYTTTLWCSVGATSRTANSSLLWRHNSNRYCGPPICHCVCLKSTTNSSLLWCHNANRYCSPPICHCVISLIALEFFIILTPHLQQVLYRSPQIYHNLSLKSMLVVLTYIILLALECDVILALKSTIISALKFAIMAAFESVSVALLRILALIKGLNPTIVVVLESVSSEALIWNKILVRHQN